VDIAVIGCGAMGSIYAALLASRGHRLLAVDTNAAHVEAINRQGLRVSGASGERTVRIRAVQVPEPGALDLVIIATKGAFAGDAARSALPLIGPGTHVLTIQNGLGAADAVADVIGADRLLVGVAQGFGASLPAPGHAHHNDMKAIRMGAFSGLDVSAIDHVVELFRDAGFDATSASDIIAMQWEKLICNAAYSALAALTGMTIGEIMDDPDAGPVSRAAAVEARDIALARGIAINVPDAVALVREFASRMPTAKPSVLLDIEAGRRSEVGVINGAVPIEAAKAGLTAPVNDTLTRLVLLLERRTFGLPTRNHGDTP
jgi:2-dehydropantoate 2-reductase